MVNTAVGKVLEGMGHAFTTFEMAKTIVEVSIPLESLVQIACARNYGIKWISEMLKRKEATGFMTKALREQLIDVVPSLIGITTEFMRTDSDDAKR